MRGTEGGVESGLKEGETGGGEPGVRRGRFLEGGKRGAAEEEEEVVGVEASATAANVDAPTTGCFKVGRLSSLGSGWPIAPPLERIELVFTRCEETPGVPC